MSESTKKALLASFSSRILAAALNIAIVPIYLRFLGAESYGLIGIFSSLQVLIAFLDFGLGSTLIREFSRHDRSRLYMQRMSDLAKISEFVYLVVAILIVLLFFSCVPWIVSEWIRLGELSPESAERALLIGVFALAIQWPGTLYYSILAGMQRQVLIGKLTIANAVLRIVITLAFFYFIGPTIELFFIAQVICAAVQISLARILVWRDLPKPGPLLKCKNILYEIGGFAGAMTAISVCSVVFTQADKVILSSTLDLKDFGVYALTNSLAAGVYIVINPLFSVIYPRFSGLVSSSSKEDILNFYHKSAQLASLITIPASVLVVFLAEKIMFTWTGDKLISEQAKWPLIFLVLGNSLNGLMNIPYAIQLASGKPKLALYTNIAAICVLLPSVFFLATKYGPAGGAFAWFLLNVLYVFISQYLTHRKILNGGMWRWYLQDVAQPLIVVVAIGALFLEIFPWPESRILSGFCIVLMYFALFISALFAMPLIRDDVSKYFFKYFRRFGGSRNDSL